MIKVRPSYYDRFVCIADKCSDNCCLDWEIDIDEETLELYQSIMDSPDEQSKNIAKKLRTAIKDGSFVLVDNRCPFLCEDNLCEIIRTLGEDKLCYICKRHPRANAYYENIYEDALTLACPSAIKLILENAEDVFDITENSENEDMPSDYAFMSETRKKLYRIMQSDNYDFKQRLRAFLDCGGDYLNYYYEYEAIEYAQREYTVYLDREYAEDKIAYKQTIGLICDVFHRFEADFETVSDKWNDILSETENIMKYDDILIEENKTNIYKQLLISYLYLYMLKGFANGTIYEVFIFAASLTLFCIQLNRNKSIEDTIENIRVISKIIDYSDVNLELIRGLADEIELDDMIRSVI